MHLYFVNSNKAWVASIECQIQSVGIVFTAQFTASNLWSYLSFAFKVLLCFVAKVAPGGVLKFGFGRDVPPQNLKVDPYKYQFFKKK